MVPLVPVLLGSVPTVPLVLPVVLVPVCGTVTVPCAPAEVPLEPVLCPSAATATTRTPLAKNVANLSLIVIDASLAVDREARDGPPRWEPTTHEAVRRALALLPGRESGCRTGQPTRSAVYRRGSALRIVS